MTDAILKKTRDVAISARDEWVSTTLLVDGQLRACAVEDADVGAQRAHNTEVITAMKLVLEELATLSEDVTPNTNPNADEEESSSDDSESETET